MQEISNIAATLPLFEGLSFRETEALLRRLRGRVQAYDRGAFLLESGRTLVPVRVLAQALGAEVDWDSATGAVTVTSGDGAILNEHDVYDPDGLYWLSRIISAESQGEPLTGKVGVGNVILNRVDHADFPDSIYGVIFDSRWGGQFEPVQNGTVYADPTAESVIAAKLVLEGADTVGDSLYFLAPALAGNHWIMENRDYVATIGAHAFYGDVSATIYTDAAYDASNREQYWNSSYKPVLFGCVFSEEGYLVSFTVTGTSLLYVNESNTVSAPVRSGYTFAGWAVTEGGAAQYAVDELGEAPVGTTLYAVWQQA